MHHATLPSPKVSIPCKSSKPRIHSRHTPHSRKPYFCTLFREEFPFHLIVAGEGFPFLSRDTFLIPWVRPRALRYVYRSHPFSETENRALCTTLYKARGEKGALPEKCPFSPYFWRVADIHFYRAILASIPEGVLSDSVYLTMRNMRGALARKRVSRCISISIVFSAGGGFPFVLVRYLHHSREAPSFVSVLLTMQDMGGLAHQTNGISIFLGSPSVRR